jgi:hypothetical protein
MASVHRTIDLSVPADKAWDAVRDIGAVDRRLVPGVLTDARLEGDGDVRVVTFASGAVVRERVVDVDNDARRFVYTVVDSPFGFRHHQATMQVLPAGEAACRIVWTSDLLPDELAAPVGDLMDQGAAAMRQAL